MSELQLIKSAKCGEPQTVKTDEINVVVPMQTLAHSRHGLESATHKILDIVEYVHESSTDDNFKMEVVMKLFNVTDMIKEATI